MAAQTNYKLLLLFFITFLLVSNLENQLVHGASQVPCYFIFGDALSANGNINKRSTIVKTDYLPYGDDFIGGPTGRSTNNRTLVDVITQLIGFDSLIPPFAKANGKEILKGVNYASYGAGILNQTGRNLGDIISFDNQLSNHMTTVSSIRLLLKNTTAADEYLSKCLYTVEVGSDDYINNYFLPNNNRTRSNYTYEQYANLLVQQYTQQLKRLYSYGARKIAVFGLDLIGLTPGIISQFGVGSVAVTTATELFTNKLPTLVNELNNGSLPGAKFTYINAGGIRITSPRLLALINVGTCCQVMDVLYTCVKGVPACPNRNLYAFFDGYHPTDISNAIQAERVYVKTLPTDASPYDIRTLVQL